MTFSPAQPRATLVWRQRFRTETRAIADEIPVAFSYNRLSHAVMMATPSDLEDFAVGFSRSEGIVASAEEIEDLDIVSTPVGIECRMWIGADHMARLEQRRRTFAGPTGCGLCGLESLAEAVRTPPKVAPGGTVTVHGIMAAVASMPPLQTLNQQTHAVHAAAFWQAGGAGLVAVREDVGRHNALDKLSGALMRAGIDGRAGFVVMTSRISVELVQKAAVIGAPILVAVSAPTQLALRMAETAGMTLVGVARPDGFEVFTCPERIAGAPATMTTQKEAP